jgi:hypothetical protein
MISAFTSCVCAQVPQNPPYTYNAVPNKFEGVWKWEGSNNEAVEIKVKIVRSAELETTMPLQITCTKQ